MKKTTKFSPRRDAQELQSQNAKQAGYPSRLGYFIQDPEKPSSPSLKPSTSNDGDDHSLEDMSSFAEDNASKRKIAKLIHEEETSSFGESKI